MSRTLERSAAQAPPAAVGRVPLLILIPAFGALAVLLLPLIGLFVRAPWSDLVEHLTSTGVTTALRLSLTTATISMVVCLILGTPLAWLLARVDFRGRQFVRALVTVPLVLPPVVGGIALLTTFGRAGVLGKPIYEAFGYQVTFTTTAVVIAQTFVALPFLVLAVEGALRSTDRRYDEVAASLGASRWWTFVRVTLPLAGPGIISGAVLAWARRSASSAPRSRSPATSRAPPARCRWRSTTPTRPTHPARSSSVCCCWRSVWGCWRRCGSVGSAG